MAIALPESGERVEKSLGILIKSQFTESDFFSVVGHTEIPARAIPSLVMLLTNQRILEILSTPDPGDADKWGDTELAAEQYETELDKYRMRLLIEGDAKAMLAAVEYGHNFYYALCMRSKDRRGRGEGVRMATAGGVREAEEGLGIGPKVLHALGLGRLTKYQKVYVKKGE